MSVYWIRGDFPLGQLLSVCGTLKRFCLGFGMGGGTKQQLELVAEHACDVVQLTLEVVDSRGGFSHVWLHLPKPEQLTIMTNKLVLVNKLYQGIAHDSSPLRKLGLGWIRKNRHLSSALNLCKAFDRRLIDLELSLDIYTDWMAVSVDDKLAQLKEACPQVAVCLTCTTSHIVPALRTPRDSLVELHWTQIGSRDVEGLTSFDAFLPNLHALSQTKKNS